MASFTAMLRATATREVEVQGDHKADAEAKVVAQIAAEGGGWEMETIKMISKDDA
ncbi:hypothetical protein [Lysinibacter cavernae]|uniref:Uncharacterized protein n=1 Tax=Lysinibacter cavernae TaxID=1640652 RepID=A0A7X5TSL7_9MICO|nr:hypothetical protein [Lysinibacter cavernae]NIH52569.1 hypothetical protein [Lysinibacter cavernae]